MATALKHQESEQLSIEIPDGARKLKIQYVRRDLIDPDPAQPRVDADDELRASIARHGLLQPITVRPHPEPKGEALYMVVDGERRWRGSEGILEELPVVVRRDQEDGARRLLTQLVANTGKALTPLEEARAYAKILRETAMPVAELAQLAGVPRSTMSERLGLLDLGPWLPLLEAGKVSVSQAVRALVPLAGVPAEYHEQAIEKIQKDYRWQKRGGADMSVGDFERLVEQMYESFMYPLKKTSSTYLKQPEFPTSKHDDECTCGGIKFRLGHSDQKRVCCGNPGWWKPLHRKALAAKKAAPPKTKASTDRGGVKLYLPDGAPTVKAGYDVPKGIVFLTDEQGRWSTGGGFSGTFDDAYDPADLVIDDAKLVRVSKTYGGDFIGTKDLAAVKAARAKWSARWAARLEELRAAFRESVDRLREVYAVSGPGVFGIIRRFTEDGDRLDRAGVDELLRVFSVFRVPVPDSVRREHGGNAWNRPRKAFDDWIAKSLTQENAEQLVTGLATLASRAVKLPELQVEEEQRAERDAIQKQKSPWTKKPKGAKSAAAKKQPAKQGRAKAVPDPDEFAGFDEDEDDVVDGADDEDIREDDEESGDAWDAEDDDA